MGGMERDIVDGSPSRIHALKGLFFLFLGFGFLLLWHINTVNAAEDCRYILQADSENYTKIRIGQESSGDGWIGMNRQQLLNSTHLKQDRSLLVDFPEATYLQTSLLCIEMMSHGFHQATFLINHGTLKLDAYSLLVLLGADREIAVVTANSKLKNFISSLSLTHKSVSVLSPSEFERTPDGKRPAGLIVVDEEKSGKAFSNGKNQDNIWLVAPSVDKLEQELAIQRIIDSKRKQPSGNARCEDM